MAGDIIDINKIFDIILKPKIYPIIYCDNDGFWYVKVDEYHNEFKCSKQLAMTYKTKSI